MSWRRFCRLMGRRWRNSCTPVVFWIVVGFVLFWFFTSKRAPESVPEISLEEKGYKALEKELWKQKSENLRKQITAAKAEGQSIPVPTTSKWVETRPPTIRPAVYQRPQQPQRQDFLPPFSVDPSREEKIKMRHEAQKAWNKGLEEYKSLLSEARFELKGLMAEPYKLARMISYYPSYRWGNPQRLVWVKQMEDASTGVRQRQHALEKKLADKVADTKATVERLYPGVAWRADFWGNITPIWPP